MRLFLLVLIVLMTASCSSRDYNLGMLNETNVNTRQAYYIRQIQAHDRYQTQTATSNDRICYTYPPALGGYTTGCSDRRTK